jgi:predicted dehydrogenase
VPFSKNRFLYNWHWFWNTGNGDIGNQGVHEMDIARWGLGVGFPNSVVASGGKYAYKDDQETPNTLLARFDYGGKELVFEVRGTQTGHEADLSKTDSNCVGNLFYGSEGWMSVDAEGFRVYKGEPMGKLVQEGKYEEPGKTDTGPHIKNFLDAIRSRKHEDLHAEIEIGRISAGLCHLANISYLRNEQVLKFDPKEERFADEEANTLARPPYRAPYSMPDLS